MTRIALAGLASVLLALVPPSLVLAQDTARVSRVSRAGGGIDEWVLESIEWPLRLFPVRTVLDDGSIAVPQEQGFIIPSRFAEGHYRYLNWIWERIAGQGAIFNQNTMRLGVKKGNSAVIGIFETPHDVLLGVILTADLLVQRTRFSGVEVTVNYGEFPYRLEDSETLPAYGYHVRDSSAGGRSHQGRVDISIAVGTARR